MEYRKYLIKTYPDIKEWAKPEYFNCIEPWTEDVDIEWLSNNINVSGRYLADNIETPSNVIDPPITPQVLWSELEKNNYTHVGFSLITSGFSSFIKCAQAVKKFDPSIQTIAGGPGAMDKRTENYVDYVCIAENGNSGRGVPFLRNLFQEDINRPYKITIIPDQFCLVYKGRKIYTEQCKIITKIGCPMKCDFCATNKLFAGEYTGEMFTPQQVHDALIDYRNQLRTQKLQVFWAEPTTIWNLKWWYEFFDLFKEDSGDFSFFVAAPSIILDKMDLDRISHSAARIGFVNIGVESFNKNYTKNRGIDISELIRKLTDYGISTYATYIVGFDFDTHDSVWEDMEKLVNLDADMFSVLNLHPLPGTETWIDLQAQNRLLSLPSDYYVMHGFQPYLHPHFKPGFVDIFPLLCEIYKYIEVEKGNIFINAAQTMENLINFTNHPKIIRREIKMYKALGKSIFNAWKEYFNPTEVQQAQYLQKVQITR
ncbi:MAG: B12-binding domain-containing radical SAM protein [Candidatus Thorarchaeota archaeon]